MVSSVKLAELWQRMGYKVVVVCMGAKTEKEVVSETLTIYRVWDFFLPDPLNYGISPGFFFKVLRVLKNEKPDIVIVNKILFWTSLIVPWLRILGKKPIVTTDALVGVTWQPRGIIPKVIMSIGGWTAGWKVMLFAKKLVFFHPQPDKILKMMGVYGKSIVIPTGIDSRAFLNKLSSSESASGRTNREAPLHSSAKADSVEESYNIHARKAQTVTYVGRLESVKGVDDFLAATVPLKKDYPDLNIQVVGYCKPGNTIVRQYEGSVKFTGLRDDIPEILSSSDIFVLPSYSEGLSNALMEAMSSRCACIATGVGGNKYLIEDSVSGLLFKPGDIEALRSHVRSLIDNPSRIEGLGNAARARIEDMFDWSVIESKYAELFNERAN